MRIRDIVVATAAVAACLTIPTNISAQKTLPELHVTPVVDSTGDVTASTATAAIPNLSVHMPGGGSLNVTLRNVTIEPPNKVQFLATSYEWIAIQAPAGRYHVSFNFTATSSSGVSIHAGQSPSDPVAARCTVTASLPGCGVIMTVPPGGIVYLATVVDSGGFPHFRNITIARTIR